MKQILTGGEEIFVVAYVVLGQDLGSTKEDSAY
jgi:hypothetical protein